MPQLDLTNPDVIKFYNENFEKATRLRIKWNSQHGQQLKKAASFIGEEKGYRETDVILDAMAAGLATITRENKVAARNRRVKPIRDGKVLGISHLKKGHSIIDVGLARAEEEPKLTRSDDDLTYDPLMRPIDPKQKKVLYKNIPTFGRNVYLKNRNKMAPDEKYYFAETSSWVCGWRLKDSYFNKNAPQHGRVWRLTRYRMSRSGPQPDPPYYQDSNALQHS